MQARANFFIKKYVFMYKKRVLSTLNSQLSTFFTIFAP